MSGKDDCYPACYRDRHGEEHILIHNDGSELTFTLRGVQFEGGELDSFAPTGWDQPDYDLPHHAGPFPLYRDCTCCASGDLYEYELTFALPVALQVGGVVRDVPLEVHVEVGPPSRTVIHSRCRYRLALENEGPIAVVQGGCNFEQGLLNLGTKLPAGQRLVCCFTCDFSDYSPGGTLDFGDLMCYRNSKSRCRQVGDRWDLFKLKPVETVQETYLCPEFEPRARKRGYRGWPHR